MKLVKNEPKVVEIALTRRNLIYLLAALSLGETNASTSTLDGPTGYLVKVSLADEENLRYTSGAIPGPLMNAISNIERCIDND